MPPYRVRSPIAAESNAATVQLSPPVAADRSIALSRCRKSTNRRHAGGWGGLSLPKPKPPSLPRPSVPAIFQPSVYQTPGLSLGRGHASRSGGRVKTVTINFPVPTGTWWHGLSGQIQLEWEPYRSLNLTGKAYIWGRAVRFRQVSEPGSRMPRSRRTWPRVRIAWQNCSILLIVDTVIRSSTAQTADLAIRLSGRCLTIGRIRRCRVFRCALPVRRSTIIPPNDVFTHSPTHVSCVGRAYG